MKLKLLNLLLTKSTPILSYRVKLYILTLKTEKKSSNERGDFSGNSLYSLICLTSFVVSRCFYANLK